MAQAMTRRRPVGSKPDPVRSVRVGDDLWEAAKRRAAYEGVTMSHVLLSIIEGYAQGLIDMPKVVVSYQPARRPQAGPADQG